MNIKNRINKLESLSNVSSFCSCRNIDKSEFYCSDFTEESTDPAPQIIGDKVIPDVCPQCGKPIEKSRTIIQLWDDTTKDRFPDEWNQSSK